MYLYIDIGRSVVIDECVLHVTASVIINTDIASLRIDQRQTNKNASFKSDSKIK